MQKIASCSGAPMKRNRQPPPRNKFCEITSRELEIAMAFWLQQRKTTDQEIRPFLHLETQKQAIKSARTALQISTQALANRLGVNRENIVRLEKSELTGALSLKKLKKAAEALDCELIYAVVPKSRKSFSVILWDLVLEEAKEQLKLKTCVKGMRPRMLLSKIEMLMNSANFRKAQGWTERLQMSHNPQGD
jgi:transcriptional regulator with XRE-family HTH domain